MPMARRVRRVGKITWIEGAGQPDAGAEEETGAALQRQRQETDEGEGDEGVNLHMLLPTTHGMYMTCSSQSAIGIGQT